MTDTYLKNITPDSLSGLIFGFEGIYNTLVLLNGPTGCKFYHSATSDNQTLRQIEFDPHNFPLIWYFGQPRVPCTYLDKRDYVYGSEDKLKDAIASLTASAKFDLLVIINSPGAALIGDDLPRIASECGLSAPVITVESPGYSKDIFRGYQEACRYMVEALADGGGNTLAEGPSPGSSSRTLVEGTSPGTSPSPHGKGKRVNLLGLSIFQKYFQGDLAEMTRLLALCGIDVHCSLGCECSVDQIRTLADADLNIVVDPDYGLPVAEYLKEKLGMPYLAADGLPIGFAETEKLFTQICDTLGCDVSKLIEDSERARARCYLYLSRVNSLTGRPRGVKYAVHGSPAQALGYSRFLTKYFGMTADVISITDTGDVNCDTSLATEKDIFHTDAELVFADGNIIANLKGRHQRFTGIEISMPSLGYQDVIPKTHLGVSGGLLLCEQILNGMLY